jgi:ribosome-associated translation inhibitor RaiA
MLLEPQITLRHMKASAAVERAVQDEVKDLQKRYPGISGCHVTLEALRGRQAPGNEFTCHLHISVPGPDVAVTRNRHEDAYTAIGLAFRAARRQLRQRLERLRGQ